MVASDTRRHLRGREAWNEVKILVTGRNGQVVRSLLERGAGRDIVALGRPDLDLDVQGSARAAILGLRPDMVINAAAYTNVDAAEDEPERAMRINGEAAGEVAAAAREVGAPVIQISTDYVFGGSAKGPYTEYVRTDPIGAYGRSKLLGEQRVRDSNPDHAIVRTAWVYSPFGRNFVKTMMTLAQARDMLSVVADQHGNPTSALDLADGLLALVDAGIAGGETYHLAGTGDATWFELAEHIFAQCARLGLPWATVTPVITADYPTKATRPANSRLDSTRFTAATGFVMPGWRASVDETIARLAAV